MGVTPLTAQGRAGLTSMCQHICYAIPLNHQLSDDATCLGQSAPRCQHLVHMPQQATSFVIVYNSSAKCLIFYTHVPIVLNSLTEHNHSHAAAHVRMTSYSTGKFF
ncbi:hypothetical protein PanWU01x14_166920 [Parasponia andersonii]|uniref:Uncharacterized protein n=1 Tax=Parasponia andersonii TaxID=3476 RepID=A0A2P5CBP4_PARAD|nr:hypothetical protein PanWU01x14_166920 [Parasponia andersonii]